MISGKPITLGHGQAYIGLDSVRQGKLGTTAIGMKESLMNETPITKAAFQLRQVCQHLPERPISLWDSEYGCAKPTFLTSRVKSIIQAVEEQGNCSYFV